MVLLRNRSSAPLEELHLALVLSGFFVRAEGAEVPAFARLRIDLARIEPILTRLEFANHDFSPWCGRSANHFGTLRSSLMPFMFQGLDDDLGSPWKGRWQSPVWSSGRHACPGECIPSL